MKIPKILLVLTFFLCILVVPIQADTAFASDITSDEAVDPLLTEAEEPAPAPVAEAPRTRLVDVYLGTYAYSSIERFATLGVVQGTGNSYFGAKDPLTLGATATILDNLLRLPNMPETSITYSGWAGLTIGKVTQLGIMPHNRDLYLLLDEYSMTEKGVGAGIINLSQAVQPVNEAISIVATALNTTAPTGDYEDNRGGFMQALDDMIGAVINDDRIESFSDKGINLVVAENYNLTEDVGQLVIAGSANNFTVADGVNVDTLVVPKGTEGKSLTIRGNVSNLNIQGAGTQVAVGATGSIEKAQIDEGADNSIITGGGDVNNVTVAAQDVIINTRGTGVSTEGTGTALLPGGKKVNPGSTGKVPTNAESAASRSTPSAPPVEDEGEDTDAIMQELEAALAVLNDFGLPPFVQLTFLQSEGYDPDSPDDIRDCFQTELDHYRSQEVELIERLDIDPSINLEIITQDFVAYVPVEDGQGSYVYKIRLSKGGVSITTDEKTMAIIPEDM